MLFRSAAALLAVISASAAQDRPAPSGVRYTIQTRYHVGGNGGWDYIHLETDGRRLYLSHETQVEVIDADSGKRVGVIPDTPGVHGIATIPSVNRGFTTNGKEHKVSMFDLKTLEVLRKIDVGKGPDGIYYDRGSNRVFTCNHGSHDITAIDPASGQVAGTLAIGGDGEQMVTGKEGLLYVNLEDTSEVVAFDPANSRCDIVIRSASPKRRPALPTIRPLTASSSAVAAGRWW